MIEGHPVLCSDIERNCEAKELRKRELLENLVEEANVLQALDATHCEVPLLGRSDCEKLLWHPVILSSPYVHLAIAYRASCLAELPVNIMQEVCRLDRCAVTVPLLEMDVLIALLREAVHRCDRSSDEDGVPLLKQLKAHLIWRGRTRDAIEIPSERTHLSKLAGFYHRDWRSINRSSVVFIKGRGIRETRLHLLVPLLSDLSRGPCESPLKTCIYADASFSTASEDECPLQAAYSSEIPVKRDGSFWRARRGALHFPDSRGGQETDEEDWEEKDCGGCSVLFEKTIEHLPQGFLYHHHKEEDDHWFELMAEINLANEALLAVCERSGSVSDEDRVYKRQRM